MEIEALFKQNKEENKDRLSAGTLEIKNYEQDFLSDIKRADAVDKEQTGRLTNPKSVLDAQKQRDAVADVSLFQKDVQDVDDVGEFLYGKKQEEDRIEEKRTELKDIRIPIEGRQSAPLIHMNADPSVVEEKLKEKALRGLLGQIAQMHWASWIRTNACRSQSPVPYRLAIAQKTSS